MECLSNGSMAPGHSSSIVHANGNGSDNPLLCSRHQADLVNLQAGGMKCRRAVHMPTFQGICNEPERLNGAISHHESKDVQNIAFAVLLFLD